MSPAPQAGALPRASLPYVAPFAAFIGSMMLERALSVPVQIGYPARCLAALAAMFFFSRGLVSWRLVSPVASALLGFGMFAIWVGPDIAFGYRAHWLFSNSLAGEATSSIPPSLRTDVLFMSVRAAGSVLLVPVLEELFWRGWMLRWLTDRDFWTVPIGVCSSSAFWITALLFASEHGPYWEVGLAAGILFNWWMLRTGSLADCILVHAAANAGLAIYVGAAGAWQYWL